MIIKIIALAISLFLFIANGYAQNQIWNFQYTAQNDIYGSTSADLFLSTTPESGGVALIEAISGTWTFQGITYPVTVSDGNDIIFEQVPNGIEPAPYVYFSEDDQYYVQVYPVGYNCGTIPCSLVQTIQNLPYYGGGTDGLVTSYTLTAPFEPSDVVVSLGVVGFIAMMWRKRRLSPVLKKFHTVRVVQGRPLLLRADTPPECRELLARREAGEVLTLPVLIV